MLFMKKKTIRIILIIAIIFLLGLIFNKSADAYWVYPENGYPYWVYTYSDPYLKSDTIETKTNALAVEAYHSHLSVGDEIIISPENRHRYEVCSGASRANTGGTKSTMYPRN